MARWVAETPPDYRGVVHDGRQRDVALHVEVGELLDQRLAGPVRLPEEAEAAAHSGAEGVGLMRTEFLVVGRATMPDEEEQYRAYKKVVTAFGDKPVVIRTLDLAARMKAGEFRERPLQGKTLAMIFTKSSTRTRVSFDNKEVRLPKGVDEGTAVLSWVGIRADALYVPALVLVAAVIAVHVRPGLAQQPEAREQDEPADEE